MVERQAKMLYEEMMRKAFNINSRLKAARKGMDTDSFSESNLKSVKQNIIKSINQFNSIIYPKIKDDESLLNKIENIKINIVNSDNLLNEISELLLDYRDNFVRKYVELQRR